MPVPVNTEPDPFSHVSSVVSRPAWSGARFTVVLLPSSIDIVRILSVKLAPVRCWSSVPCKLLISFVRVPPRSVIERLTPSKDIPVLYSLVLSLSLSAILIVVPLPPPLMLIVRSVSNAVLDKPCISLVELLSLSATLIVVPVPSDILIVRSVPNAVLLKS